MNKGILAVVSGFSGAGKGTVMKELLGRYENYALSISATTRKPREGEADGREYFFLTREEFQKLIREDQLLEYACYVDNYYGTPRAYVEKMLEQGKDVILEIEMQGAMKIKEKIPEAMLIFVTPPSVNELMRRLEKRGTESPEAIASRMRQAVEESGGMENYDFLLINDDLETCVEELHRMIQSEKARTSRNQELIEKIRSELEAYMKGDL